MRDFNESYTIRDFVDKNKWSNVYIGINNETKQNIILNMLINIDGNEGKIEKLVETKITNLGYELYDVQYVKEGKDYFLRIFIDKPKGISLEDCEKVNNEITDLLDTADYIKQQYFLEVSSPGIERILRKEKHLNDNIGETIEIKLFKPINKKKEIIGVLKQFDENTIVVLTNDEQIEISRRDISQIKKVYNW